MLLSMELMKYCTKNNMKIYDILEIALCKFLKIERKKLKDTEREYHDKIQDDFKLWGKLLNEYNEIEIQYNKMITDQHKEEKEIKMKYKKMAEEEIRKKYKKMLESKKQDKLSPITIININSNE